MNDTYKYICETCSFKSKYKSLWEKHIETTLHKTGKRKIRADIKEPFKCNNCNYETKNKTTLKQHILNEHANIEQREKEFKYYCKQCDHGTFAKDLNKRHMESDRHKKHVLRSQQLSHLKLTAQ